MGIRTSTSVTRSAHIKPIKEASGPYTVGHPHRKENARLSHDLLLIWLDQAIDEENNRDCQKTIGELRRIVNNITTFTDEQQCIRFLSTIKDEKVCIIISGLYGRKTVPRIHSLSIMDSIFIYCGNIALHEAWTKEWSKIKGIFNNIAQLCEAVKEAARQCQRNSISMTITPVNTGGSITNEKLNHVGPSFVYTQVLKEILLTIDFKEHHFNEFIDFYRELYTDEWNVKSIEQFKQEYRIKTPIWWYTSDFLIYTMLNHALRVMDMNIIIRMGFFVADLHHHLEQLHHEQFGGDQSNKSFTVFRGQSLSNASFEAIRKNNGGLLSFNSFLSTSKSRNVSLGFARRSICNNESIGILFVMTVDPTISTVPFASINDVSYFGHKEDEVLFSMHTVFRICGVKRMDDKHHLYEVELTLSSVNDKDCHALTTCVREWTEGSTGWDRLGQLLLKLGQPEKAQQVYEVLLEQATDEVQKGNIYHRLGSAKYLQGKYQDAITFYEQALKIRQQSLPPDHPDLAMSYNNIGNVYAIRGNYSKALSSHERALEIRQQALSPNLRDLAHSYDNIGLVACSMNDHSKALSSHEEALKIRQKFLPTNHPDLAISYNNIGTVYRIMGEYSEALSFYKQAVNVGQRSLPSDHPHLQTFKKNLDIIRKTCN